MKIRLPVELKDQIDGAAKANNRSMNAEIVARLQASFDPGTANLTTADIRKLLDAQHERFMASVKETVATWKSKN